MPSSAAFAGTFSIESTVNDQTLILAVNSITFGGLLFLLSSGFSLIFGLMRIPEPHSRIAVHARCLYWRDVRGRDGLDLVQDELLARGGDGSALPLPRSAELSSASSFGGLPGNNSAQVLVTLGIAFMVADFCLMVWTGDPVTVPTPPELVGANPDIRADLSDLSRWQSSVIACRLRECSCGCCSIAHGSVR